MCTNLSAGMGDPYWYEWLIGVNYALDMLPPDNDIDYVTLQASELQGEPYSICWSAKSSVK